MRVRYTVPAARRLARVLDDIAEHSPQGAQSVQARIQATVTLLAQFPYAGNATGRRSGTRRIVASPYPYLIFYRVTEDEIIIDSVRHAARRPLA